MLQSYHEKHIWMIITVISNESTIVVRTVFPRHILNFRGQVLTWASDLTHDWFGNELLLHGDFKQVLNGIEYEDECDEDGEELLSKPVNELSRVAMYLGNFIRVKWYSR